MPLLLGTAALRLDFPGGASGKEPTAKAGDVRDSGLLPGLGRSPGESHGWRSLVGYSPQGPKGLDMTE